MSEVSINGQSLSKGIHELQALLLFFRVQDNFILDNATAMTLK